MKTITRLLGAPTASAAPEGDVTAQAVVRVRSGAAARGDARLDGTFPWWVADYGSGYQDAQVDCWKDGAWATGDYRGNRWFRAYVSHTGNATQWAFAHSSYVTDQSAVRGCRLVG